MAAARHFHINLSVSSFQLGFTLEDRKGLSFGHVFRKLAGDKNSVNQDFTALKLTFSSWKVQPS